MKLCRSMGRSLIQKEMEEELDAARSKVEQANNQFELQKAQLILESLENKAARVQEGT